MTPDVNWKDFKRKGKQTKLVFNNQEVSETQGIYF